MSSCVVTGAALGMGRGDLERVLVDGMDVVGVDWNAEALERAAVELGDRFVPLRADVGDWETHVRAADLAETSGPLAAWVNNAGIDIQGGAHEVTPEEIERGLRVLQLGVMYGTAIAVRRMLPAVPDRSSTSPRSRGHTRSRGTSSTRRRRRQRSWCRKAWPSTTAPSVSGATPCSPGRSRRQ